MRTASVLFVEYYDAFGDVSFREYYDCRRPVELVNLLNDANPTNPDIDQLVTQAQEMTAALATRR